MRLRCVRTIRRCISIETEGFLINRAIESPLLKRFIQFACTISQFDTQTVVVREPAGNRYRDTHVRLNYHRGDKLAGDQIRLDVV